MAVSEKHEHHGEVRMNAGSERSGFVIESAVLGGNGPLHVVKTPMIIMGI